MKKSNKMGHFSHVNKNDKVMQENQELKNKFINPSYLNKQLSGDTNEYVTMASKFSVTG